MRFTPHLIVGAIALAVLGAIIITLLTGPEIVSGEEVCDLADNDGDGQVDEGFRTTCSDDADCGPTGPFGEAFCRGNDVYRGYYASACTGEAGTCLSECAAQQTERLIEECPAGCLGGRCR